LPVRHPQRILELPLAKLNAVADRARKLQRQKRNQGCVAAKALNPR
jgi:hypothetical protein